MTEQIKKNEKKKRQKVHHDPRRAMVRIVALIMAVSMVFAVTATTIFYLQYYLK